MTDDLEQEIEKNLFAFLPKLPSLLPEHEGSFAVLRHQRIEGIHARLSEALQSAHARFADGMFSIQRITEKPVELGLFSSADDQG